MINIGYSFDEIIPENNVISLRETIRQPGFRRGVPADSISCFTTLGHEDAPWIVSTNNFSTDPLFIGTNSVDLGGGIRLTLTIDRLSRYHSSIYIDANGNNFTINLTCQSQSNPAVHYTVIITTSKTVCVCACLCVSVSVTFTPLPMHKCDIALALEY